MFTITKFLIRDQAGTTAVEYAILASAIAGVIVAVVLALGIKVSGLLEAFNSQWGAR